MSSRRQNRNCYDENCKKEAQIISVSTRGVGVNLALTLNHLTVYFSQKINPPNIYALYRVYLAIIETKMQIIKEHYPFQRYTQLAAPSFIWEIEIMRRNLRLLTPLTKLINALGIVKIADEIYIPVIPRDQEDSQKIYIPRSEVVTYSNLRKTVTALSASTTPECYRRDFHKNCCIPGAIWHNELLVNADEIMPENYDTDELEREMLMVTLQLNNHLNLYVPNLMTGPFQLSPQGTKAIFMCNDQETLKLPDRKNGEDLAAYYERCIPEGGIKSYHSPYQLTTPERIDGAISLLGERTKYSEFSLPLGVHRLNERCSYYCPLSFSASNVQFWNNLNKF